MTKKAFTTFPELPQKASYITMTMRLSKPKLQIPNP